MVFNLIADAVCPRSADEIEDHLHDDGERDQAADRDAGVAQLPRVERDQQLRHAERVVPGEGARVERRVDAAYGRIHGRAGGDYRPKAGAANDPRPPWGYHARL